MQLKLLHNHSSTLGKTNLGSSSKQYCTPWPWCISQSTINTLKAGHFVNTRQLNCIIFLIIETITFPGRIFASHIAPLWQHYWIHRTHWQHCAYCDVLEAWMGIRNVFKKNDHIIYLFSLIVFWLDRTQMKPICGKQAFWPFKTHSQLFQQLTLMFL